MLVTKFRDRINRAIAEVAISPVRKVVPWNWYYDVMDIYLRYRGFLFAGDKAMCPICGCRFREFISSPHDLCCPRCDSKDRFRLIYQYLKEETSVFEGNLRIAHFAPELSLQRRIREIPNLEYFTVDLDSTMVDYNMNIMDLDFEDDFFDGLICSHVLEHVENDMKAMSELHRVLRPGGWAIILVPLEHGRATTLENPTISTSRKRRELFGQSDHLRVYGRDFPDRLRASGFSVSAFDYCQTSGEELCQRYGIINERTLWICRKGDSVRSE